MRTQLLAVKQDRDRLTQELKKAEHASLVLSVEAVSEKEASLRRAKVLAEVGTWHLTLGRSFTL